MHFPVTSLLTSPLKTTWGFSRASLGRAFVNEQRAGDRCLSCSLDLPSSILEFVTRTTGAGENGIVQVWDSFRCLRGDIELLERKFWASEFSKSATEILYLPVELNEKVSLWNFMEALGCRIRQLPSSKITAVIQHPLLIRYEPVATEVP
ncbi:hypothetical protein R1flu_010408 [Riccia fluitans]|uniref:Uncharacterized protein n=1 Tax=Riccia fluitans TaxID=41844 RepID=A0ABD1Z4W5_9MARC